VGFLIFRANDSGGAFPPSARSRIPDPMPATPGNALRTKGKPSDRSALPVPGVSGKGSGYPESQGVSVPSIVADASSVAAGSAPAQSRSSTSPSLPNRLPGPARSQVPPSTTGSTFGSVDLAQTEVFNQSSSGTAPQQIEQEIHVPRGAQLPAAIVDEGAGLQPAQAAAADAIADSFLNAIEQGGSGNGVSTGNKPLLQRPENRLLRFGTVLVNKPTPVTGRCLETLRIMPIQFQPAWRRWPSSRGEMSR
jgi:hypothetical protein